METSEMMLRLFKYNEWANRRAIDSLKEPANQSAKAVRALAHLLIAEKTWLARMLTNQDSTGFDFWQGSTLEECEQLAEEVSKEFAEFLDGLTDQRLDQVATYKNSKGVEYQTSYRDILQHVLMHSAYHRGQVAMAVRAEDGTPPYTDYIAFVREN
ncbi:MAG TPA: DinB family protein [Blastocatellia bacterium]|nr:DinB family protein [Blastocatellia bacterium]